MRIRYWFVSIISVLLMSMVSLITPNRALAAGCPDLDFLGVKPERSYELGSVSEITFTIYSPNNYFGPGDDIELRVTHDWATPTTIGPVAMDANGHAQFTINDANSFESGHHMIQFNRGFVHGYCILHKYKIDGSFTYGNVLLSQQRVIDGTTKTCYGGPRTNGCLEAGVPTTIRIEGLKRGSIPHLGEIKVNINGHNPEFHHKFPYSDPGITLPTTYTFPAPGGYGMLIEDVTGINNNFFDKDFRIQRNCTNLCQEAPPPENGNVGADVNPYKICDQIDKAMLEDMYNKCIDCVGGDEEGRSGVWTAIGCIKKDPVNIVQNLIKLGLGIGGGVALIMILVSGFIFSVSQGDAKRTGEARDMLVAAITGLIFIIFSVTILQFIGYSVFRIPGFGG